MKFSTKKVMIAVALAAGAAWAVRRRARADQAWFWTPEWQAGERAVDQELKDGDSVVFASPEEMFEAVTRADV